MVQYISLRGLCFDINEMFIILDVIFQRNTLMLLGNVHLMDKSEVRIILHKLIFILKTEQVPLRYEGFKVIYGIK
jgi:hypothetical protein